MLQDHASVICCVSKFLLRATTGEQRFYLLRISQDFTFLIGSAIDGSYLDGFFGDAASPEGYRQRLRAVIQNTSMAFARTMRERGHAKHTIDTVTKNQSRVNPRLISKDEYVGKVLSLMIRCRGRELPATYNPHIIGDLFRERSEPWQALVHSFVIEVWEATQATLRLILNHVADANTAASLRQKVLQPALNILKDSLDEAVGTMLEQIVNGHPITYNHYLTENIQKLRAEQHTAVLSHKLDQSFGTNVAQSTPPQGAVSLSTSISSEVMANASDIAALKVSPAAHAGTPNKTPSLSSTQLPHEELMAHQQQGY